MKPNQTVSLAVSLAPVLAAAPPVLIGAAIGLGLIWLFAGKNEAETPEQPAAQSSASSLSANSEEISIQSKPLRASAPRRVTREDIAEALGYGARPVPRADAVAALQSLGFKKTAAYKALSQDGRFADLLEHSADGSIEWQG
jgi:hypothetical protein